MLIPFKDLFKKYDVKCKGIIHIGAHWGQEAAAYWDEGVRNILFIEALRLHYKQLVRNMEHYPGVICINACITDKDGEIVPFSVSNNEGQSSSIFEFDEHKKEHPGVVMLSHTRLQTATVDTILKDKNLNPEDYNFVNIDIQGAELLALKGMDLSNIDYAYIEVNEKHLYKDCPLIGDIDAYLLRFGLHRVETKMTNHGWGDAFYIRRVKEMLNAAVVPAHFQPIHPFPYPGDNAVDFERWYFENFTESYGRTYLPIMWTAYYCRHSYGSKIAGLQKFLESLDRGKKYYTIVQYDDGILNDLSGFDIKVFSMSGKPMDYPLPLICMDHAPVAPRARNIFASFIGRITHPVRQEIMKIKHPNWFIDSKVHKMTEYCNVLASSLFTLCPRGYGPTSFRIKEAMQYGSIPVYISDVLIIPHNVPFDLYGVLVKPEQVKNLPEILAGVDVVEKQKSLATAYTELYTYQANKRIIDDHCAI